MNSQVKVTPTSEIANTAQTSATPSNPELQALWDLGQLLFFANTYESLVANGSPQPQTANALAEFQKLYDCYHISNGNATFDYTDANGDILNISITDPNILEILKNIPILSNPPTAADVATFQAAMDSTSDITWSDGQSESILGRMLLVTYDAQYSMEDNLQNTSTNTALLMFYLSLVNAPGNATSGLLDSLLSEGYYDGALLNDGNVGAIAQVLRDEFGNNPALKAVVLAGLQDYPKDSLYTLLGTLFASDTAGNAALNWDWEARFFPTFGLESKQSTPGVIPDEQNTYLENRVELEKKEMSQRDQADTKPFLKPIVNLSQ